MKRRILLIVVILVTLGATQSFALGIGVEGNFGYGNQTGVGGIWATAKIADLPYLGLGVNFTPYELGVGLTADWWLIHDKITGPLNWYLGLGPYVGLHLYTNTNDPVQLSLGARLPIGLQIFPIRWLELFLEVAPELGVRVGGSAVPELNVIGTLGLRFWTDR